MDSIRAREHLRFHHRNRSADGRALQRAAAKGELTRLPCGAFVPTLIWHSLTAAERRRLATAAVAEKHGDLIASHRSAAALWRIPSIVPGVGPVHARATMAAGTRTEHGLRKHAVHELELHVTAICGISCTTLERTVLDLAATESFAEAVVAADWALAAGTTKASLRAALDEWNPARGRRRIEQVIDFADGRSGSPGESWSRVQIEEAGLPAPILQQAFFDAEGPIGAVDFWWPEYALIGEFDGLKKYKEPAMLQGRDPGEVVAVEKVREDRLRAVTDQPRVTRWIWNALLERSLSRRLQAAGLPRRR